ncbi:MAG: alanine racemase [Oscillospiraceae bacterium]|nr:alanine racemase [Oscillospiraceae bacterium]
MVVCEGTRAELSFEALKNNVSEINRLSLNKEIIAVVKANAYGHGAEIICPALEILGVNHFAVSCVDEALCVKKYVPSAEILIFGFTAPNRFSEVVENNFILGIGDIEYAKSASSYAASAKTKIRTHIKLNTGMNRVGLNSKNELDAVLSFSGLSPEALYTHFSAADSFDKDDINFTRTQQEKLLALSRESGLKIHSQNSGGVLYHSDFKADYVRVGIMLYGLSPAPYETSFSSPAKLSPVMTFKTNIRQIRTLETGDFVSYGRTYRSDAKRLAAFIPVGYADGYSRLNSNSGMVAVKNTICPVIGRVCMDSTMIDISEAEGVNVGDEVLLYSDRFKETSIEYIADRLGTIPYEVVCALSGRVKRTAFPAVFPR